ncbi:unnamed protein product [Closterium sp. Yama58-4]|nr:unnamed protein product [Closterium sp. Yama58-4]
MSLETLFLVNCSAIPQLPARFCSLTAIKKLAFVELPLEALPSDIEELTNLESLFLYGRYIQQISASFAQLSSLKRLKLYDCRIGELPEEIGKLSRLQELTITSCTIRKLPEAVTCLVDLQVLVICDLESISVPTRLDNFTKLKVLQLPRFALPHEPPKVLPSSLETLSLGFYRFSQRSGHVEFGKAISRNLVNLKHLKMVLDDDAEKFPFPLRFSPDLRTLEIISAKSLKKLPRIGLALQQLRKLKMIHANSLTELPASITKLQHLTSLQCCLPSLLLAWKLIGVIRRAIKHMLMWISQSCSFGKAHSHVFPHDLSRASGVSRISTPAVPHTVAWHTALPVLAQMV